MKLKTAQMWNRALIGGLFSRGQGTVATPLGLALGIFFFDTPILSACLLTLYTLLSVFTLHYEIQRKELQNDSDQSVFVCDEVAGAWLTLIPAYYCWGTLPMSLLFVASFALFRFFDILKPFPIGWLDQNVDGAWGVMLDDLLAGLISGAIIFGGTQLWWQLS